MKHALLCLFFFSFYTLHAQNVTWSEDFESGFPPDMIGVDNDGLTYQGSLLYPDGWKVQNRLSPFLYFTAAGNLSPVQAKVKFQSGDSICGSTSWYDPAGQADDWLITPQVSVPSNGMLCFDVLGANYWTYILFSLDHYEVRLSTTGTNLTDFTTTLASNSTWPWWEQKCIDLSAYAGQNVYFAFVNNTSNHRYVWLDNIELLQLETADAGTGAYFPETWGAVGKNFYPRVIISNHGAQNLSSVEVHFEAEGNVYTQNMTGLNLAPMERLDTVLNVYWQPSVAGTQTVRIWTAQPNATADTYAANDTTQITVEVYAEAVPRVTLIETASGSDCGPCAYLAEVMTDFYDFWGTNSITGKVAALEYQTFPNDPSDNPDATARSVHYNVTGYPDEFVNGEFAYLGNYCTDDRYRRLWDYEDTWFSNQPAFIDMSVSLDINGNTATVTVDVMPLQDFTSPDLKLFIGIAEKIYTYTGGATFQTEYEHVLRKFLPDYSGISIGPLTAGTPVQYSESYTFTVGSVTSGSYNLWVGMNNIEAVAFIQDYGTDEIHQAAMRAATDPLVATEDALEPDGLNVWPNPADQEFRVRWEGSGDANLSVRDLAGRKILDLSAAGPEWAVDAGGWPSGFYFVEIRQGSRLLSVKKIQIRH